MGSGLKAVGARQRPDPTRVVAGRLSRSWRYWRICGRAKARKRAAPSCPSISTKVFKGLGECSWVQDQTVAFAPNRVQVYGVGGVIAELFTQAVDLHVDATVHRVMFITVHRI